jgi:hypothetical protein
MVVRERLQAVLPEHTPKTARSTSVNVPRRKDVIDAVPLARDAGFMGAGTCMGPNATSTVQARRQALGQRDVA